MFIAETKILTSGLPLRFIFSKCKEMMQGMWVRTRSCVLRWKKKVCYLRDILNDSGGWEAAVTPISRVSCVRFRSCDLEKGFL